MKVLPRPGNIHKILDLFQYCNLLNAIFILFIYKLRTQCHTIIAETVQNNNRHWHRPTQVLKHLRVALKHKHETIKTKIQKVQVTS